MDDLGVPPFMEPPHSYVSLVRELFHPKPSWVFLQKWLGIENQIEGNKMGMFPKTMQPIPRSYSQKSRLKIPQVPP